jgi:hypothetical protein
MSVQLQPIDIEFAPAWQELFTNCLKEDRTRIHGPLSVRVQDDGLMIQNGSIQLLLVAPHHIDALIGAVVEARAVGRHLYGHGSK